MIPVVTDGDWWCLIYGLVPGIVRARMKLHLAKYTAMNRHSLVTHLLRPVLEAQKGPQHQCGRTSFGGLDQKTLRILWGICWVLRCLKREWGDPRFFATVRFPCFSFISLCQTSTIVYGHLTVSMGTPHPSPSSTPSRAPEPQGPRTRYSRSVPAGSRPAALQQSFPADGCPPLLLTRDCWETHRKPLLFSLSIAVPILFLALFLVMLPFFPQPAAFRGEIWRSAKHCQTSFQFSLNKK